MSNNPNYQNLLINLRSDDPSVNPGNNNANDTSLFFPFSRTIDVPLNNYLDISVLSAEIPNTWYSWDQDQQMKPLWTRVGGASLITDQVWTFPAKRWTPCSWLASFNSQKAAKVATLKISQAEADRLVITWDKTTLKWTFTGGQDLQTLEPTFVWGVDIGTPATSPDYFRVTVLPTLSDARAINSFFGFPMRKPDVAYDQNIWLPSYGDRFVLFTTLTPGGATGSNTLISTIVADASRYHTISVTSRSLHTDSLDTTASDVGDQHVLSKIPVNAPFGSMVLFNGSTQDGFLFKNQRFQFVDIALSDHSGTDINLNGARFNITLLVKFILRVNPGLPIAPLPPIPSNISTGKELESSFVDSRVRRRTFKRRRRFGS